MEPVVEKVQQEPHCPWFLIGVTTFLSRQSTEEGRLSSRHTLLTEKGLLEEKSLS